MGLESNKYFSFNVILLKAAGMWVPAKDAGLKKKILYYAYNMFWLMYTCVIFIPSELMYLRHTASSLTDLIDNLNMAMTHILTIIKVCTWFTSYKTILKVTETLTNYSDIYEDFEDFLPKKIFSKEKFIKDFWCKGFMVVGVFLALGAFLAPMKALYFADIDMSQNSTTDFFRDLLPYPSLIPFDFTASKKHCALAIFYQCVPFHNSSWMIAGFDSLFVALLSYISAHLLLIQGAFRTIRQRCLRELGLPNEPNLHDPEELDRAMIAEMNRITKHLQDIFDICDQIESVYSFVTLAQILISLIVLCTCLYMVSSIPLDDNHFYAEVTYLVAIEFQLANYCYFGNKITLSCEDMGLALYESDWFAASASFKRSMLITMARMQKPIYITIGKFSPLTLTTFVTISRGSYSYFAVLNKVD